MALQRTGLVIVAAPLPPDFCGTMQELHEAFVERYQILSPSGIAFFSQGSVLPASDMGLFLLNGTQLFVFDPNQGIYIPLDISSSENPDFFVGPNDPGPPGPNDPVFWIRTQENHTVGLYGWDGAEWIASANVDSSGTTADRPGNPANLEHFFDETISTELIFERGAWRTVGGSVGDLKYVVHPTLEVALQYNPGWEYFGLNDETLRGRALAGAAKDVGATPAASFTTSSGITPRAAGDKFGEENHVLSSAEHEKHVHLVGIEDPVDGNGGRFHRADAADVLAIPNPVPPNYFHFSGDGFTPTSGTSGPGGAGKAMITSGQLLRTVAPNYTDVAAGHNTVSPHLYQWCLVKL